MTWGMIALCGMVGPLRVMAEQSRYCEMAVSATASAYKAQHKHPVARWTVVYVQDYIDDGHGHLLRGATQREHRRIYVVTAEPRTIYHELHHAWDAEHGYWQSSLTHGRWTCQDWMDEYVYSGSKPTWSAVCGE